MPASLADFIKSLQDKSSEPAYAHAANRVHGIPLYDGEHLRVMNSEELHVVKQEWAECWLKGAGVIVINGFYADTNIVQAMSTVMFSLLEKEHTDKNLLGDHFAKQGANQRIWNVLEKSAIQDPEVFINYYSNPLLGAIAEAWLGPGYQMTAQVNLVPPGGSAAQQPHRDYHLGFQSDDEVAKFPLHAQTMSAKLTLQGAVAHVDMPVESGPTKLLPFSQQYDLGYQIYRQDDFKAYFEQHAVQLPLSLGDAVFFSPALMHGAGSNMSTDVLRLANLLQVSSPLGIPMEMVNRDRIQLACYQALKLSAPTGEAMDTLMTVISDSYPFPTNLDRDAPDKSMTPTSSKQLLQRALDQGLEKTQYEEMLADYRWRRSTA